MSGDCRAPSLSIAPSVDRIRCEAKGQCVRVCPFGVFEIGTLSRAQHADLPLVAKLKAWAHGNRQTVVVRPADCHACGLCVQAFPERAISLVPYRAEREA
jgi:NAD-dependent dihydropyrimidine dehydrogenase PreA subunit